MKNLIRFFTVPIVLFLAFSCGNQFLEESVQTSLEDVSTIFISPDWDAKDYVIFCQNVGNAKFKVTHTPDWLIISSSSGQFVNNVAALNCKAKVHSAFSEMGIYHSYITLSIEGKGNRVLPVTYITEGNPVIETENRLTMDYDNTYNTMFSLLTVRNTGKGILFWRVVEHPDWLKVYNNDELVDPTVSGIIIPQNATYTLRLECNPSILSENQSGKIVLVSNDKNKPVVEIEVQIDQGNPVIETAKSLSIRYDGVPYGGWLSVKNIGNGILLWNISELPEWLSIEEISDNPFILPKNAEGTVYISYNPNFPFQENLSGKIVLASNDNNKPKVEVEIIMDWGNPSWGISCHELDFGRMETNVQFEIHNRGYGVLVWKLEDFPEWLTVSESNGIIMYNDHKTTLTFTCNRELMPNGINTVTIQLVTNDREKPSFPITVTARNSPTNSNNIVPIDGNITDAYFDRQTDILYLTTAQPNRFVAYDTKNRTIIRELSLNRAPTCFSISEDGKQAVIGHGGYISSVDMEKFSIKKTMEVNYYIFDIEWGVDNWVCYTPREDMFYDLQWINLDTEEIFDTPYSGLRGGTLVKKIPNQNYIVASVSGSSPSGIYIFDIETRTFVKHFHEDLLGYSPDGFWFSSDGNYLFCLLNLIYSTSSFFTSSNDVSPISKFSPAPYRIFWADHNPASRSVWILSSTSSWFWDDEEREIIQYEDTNYTRKSTWYYDDTHNGRHVCAHYIFANQAGTELVVIRNATSGDFMWSLEFIPVE